MARYLDDGEGALVNQPVNQVAKIAAVVTTATTTSTPYGFATQAQGDALVARVNSIITALVAAGIMKSA